MSVDIHDYADGTPPDWGPLITRAAAENPFALIALRPISYVIRSTVKIQSSPVALGCDGVSNWEGGCRLIVPYQGMTAIHAANAKHTRLENIGVHGPGGIDPTLPPAVLFEAHAAESRNLTVYKWPSTGVSVRGSTIYNSNCFRLERTTVKECGGHGIHIETGADTNAGEIVGSEITGCGGDSHRDESALGNLWLGCHSSGSKGAAYRCDRAGKARSVFVCCYSEGSDPIIISHPSIWLGGVGMNISGGGIIMHEGALLNVSLGNTRIGSMKLGPEGPYRFLRFGHSSGKDWFLDELPTGVTMHAGLSKTRVFSWFLDTLGFGQFWRRGDGTGEQTTTTTTTTTTTPTT